MEKTCSNFEQKQNSEAMVIIVDGRLLRAGVDLSMPHYDSKYGKLQGFKTGQSECYLNHRRSDNLGPIPNAPCEPKMVPTCGD